MLCVMFTPSNMSVPMGSSDVWLALGGIMLLKWWSVDVSMGRDRVLSGQVCFRPTPLMCYRALSCFSCSWLWEQLTKPEPRRLVGSRAPSVREWGGLLGRSLSCRSSWKQTAFRASEGSIWNTSLLDPPADCVLWRDINCLLWLFALKINLKGAYFGKFTFIRCLNTNVYPQCVRATSQ